MFSRKRRTELLIRYGQDKAVAFYNIHQDEHDIEVVSPPTEGVAMIKVRESALNSLFYLGEVTISETKLRVNGHLGIGVLHGDLEVSRALAFIDACFSSGLYTEELNDILNTLTEVERETINNRTESIMKTKVDFETMDV